MEPQPTRFKYVFFKYVLLGMRHLRRSYPSATIESKTFSNARNNGDGSHLLDET